ncbi:MAG TPA: class I SAM-dependent methyltransferase [Gemmatimonadaceae bacterium]|jgi:hypothetical protein|nr:class I SAM-dependent methyltransferase [Gemmatimonadaceae bacterium]
MNVHLSLVEGVLLGVVVVLAVALRIIARRWARHRRSRREDGRGRPWLLRRVPVHELDRVFTPDTTLGYSHETTVTFICLGPLPVVGVTSDYEAWILAVLARHATTMFEFGTCTGRTAFLWARNSPAHARAYTLTLDPAHANLYQAAASDESRDEADALQETFVERYLYTGTDVAHKVIQLYGDSKTFDDTPFAGACDLIFVDGSHARSYVMSDSEKALRMIKPGGIILWHDYRGPHRARGVFEALNALGTRLPLIHIEGTSLVAYRATPHERVVTPEIVVAPTDDALMPDLSGLLGMSVDRG